jgi:hypothetical protein
MASTLPQVTWLLANREKLNRYVFILQFVAALPFLLFSYSTGKVHARILMEGIATTGTIVASVPVQFSLGSNSSLSSRTSYEAVVVFTVGDRQFRFQEWKATKFEPTVGSRVRVLYDPLDPGSAMLDRGYLNSLPWAPSGAIGLFLFLVALKGLLTLLLSSPRQ